jgi:hypothetical protein
LWIFLLSSGPTFLEVERGPACRRICIGKNDSVAGYLLKHNLNYRYILKQQWSVLVTTTSFISL